MCDPKNSSAEQKSAVESVKACGVAAQSAPILAMEASGCGAATISEATTSLCCTRSSCGTESANAENTESEGQIEKAESRWMRIWRSTWKDFKQVLPYLLLGITQGSFIYGFIPTELIAKYAGEGIVASNAQL